MLRILIGMILSCLLATPALASSFYSAIDLPYESIKTTGASDISYGGYNPRLAFGIENLFANWYYLAGEVFYGPISMTVNNNPDNNGSLKTSYSYGVSVIPGLNFDDIVIGYARIGAIRTRFSSIDVNKSGFQIGAGLQGVINACWRVRGDYVRTIYNSISGIGDPKADQYSVGLIYAFA